MEVIRLRSDALSKLVRHDIVPSCILYLVIVIPCGLSLRSSGPRLVAGIALFGAVVLAVRFGVDIRAIATGRKDILVNTEGFGLRGSPGLIPFSNVLRVVRQSGRFRPGYLLGIRYSVSGPLGTVERELRLRPDDYERPEQLVELIEKRVRSKTSGVSAVGVGDSPT
jgi:hypothetical protein